VGASTPEDERTPGEDGTPEKGYLSRGEAAQRLGVSPRTIQQWARDGKIPCLRTFGGHRRFSVKDLDVLQEAAKNARRRSPQRRRVIA
jgi:excisionase family DNA binding protein